MSETIGAVAEKIKKKSFFNGILSKIKRIKHLDKIISVLFIAVILLIYFSSINTSGQSKNEKQNNYNISSSESSLLKYENELEKKIKNTISFIKNAGNVEVMVYFSEGIETVIAYKTEIQKNEKGIVIETKSPVLITNDGKSQPIILQENMPIPSSVVVIATGASNTNVKLEILRAVQAMFNYSNCNIEIFAGN